MAQMVSYSRFCRSLQSNMDKVCHDREPLLIVRRTGRNVILMSAEEYGGLLETVHLLKSPANAARLLQSIAEADRGGGS